MTETKSRPFSPDELKGFHRKEWSLKTNRLAPIVHNLMPIIGVVFLGWSGSLTLASLWLDGFVGLGLGVALFAHRMSLDPPVIELNRREFMKAWVVLMMLLGIPYYIGLASGWRMFGEAISEATSGSGLALAVLGVMLVADVLSIRSQWRAERDVIPRPGAIAREMIVHLARAFAVVLLISSETASVFAVCVLAIVYSYLETFPNSFLLFFIGHPKPGSPYDAWKKQYDPEALLEPEPPS